MEARQYMNMPMPTGDVRIGGYASYGPRMTEVVAEWDDPDGYVIVRSPVGDEAPEFWGVYVPTHDKTLNAWVWEWRADFATEETAAGYCRWLAESLLTLVRHV